MSDLGTVRMLAFSRAPDTIDFRYLRLRPLPAITASTDFPDSTGRKPSSILSEASAFTACKHWNINQFPDSSDSTYGRT